MHRAGVGLSKAGIIGRKSLSWAKLRVGSGNVMDSVLLDGLDMSSVVF